MSSTNVSLYSMKIRLDATRTLIIHNISEIIKQKTIQKWLQLIAHIRNQGIWDYILVNKYTSAFGPFIKTTYMYICDIYHIGNAIYEISEQYHNPHKAM